MERVLVSGSAGFIGGYVVEELLNRGYAVVGLDDFSKYGKVRKSYDDDPRYRLVEGDARDVGLMSRLLADCDHFIAGAAMIGGISYFHTYAYDLLATNERIIAASCDAAIAAHRDGRLRKVKGEGVPLRLVHDDPFQYDVQRRVPDTEKAKKVLGFEATTTLDQMLDEVIPWIDAAIKAGTI